MASILTKTFKNYKLATNVIRTLYPYTPNFKHSTKKKQPANPGIQNFIEEFQITEDDIDQLDYDFDHLEHYGEYEDNITHVEKLEEQLVRDKKQEKKISRFKIVERKGGFKPPKETNLLTYEAKCQIRYLHAKDPIEWTPEKIAECFPISPEGAKRLLKHKELLEFKSVKKHNEQVAKNWQLLKAGSPKVSPVTLALYKKMKWSQEASYPSLNLPQPETLPLKPDYSQPDYSLPEKLGPFLSIVKVYVKQKQREIKQLQEVQVSQEKATGEVAKTSSSPVIIDDTETSLSPENHDTGSSIVKRASHISNLPNKSTQPSSDVALKQPPFDPLRSSAYTTIEDVKNASYIHPDRESRGTPMTHEVFKESLTLNIKEFCKSHSTSSHMGGDDSSANKYSIEKFVVPSCTLSPDLMSSSESFDETMTNGGSKGQTEELASESIPTSSQSSESPIERQRIHIPKKFYKKGALYKVNNCYYNDEGEFLYEVPY